MQCPKCGENVSASAKFCSFCGKKFTQARRADLVKRDTSIIPVQQSSAQIAQEDVARCPLCGSTSLQAMK